MGALEWQQIHDGRASDTGADCGLFRAGGENPQNGRRDRAIDIVFVRRAQADWPLSQKAENDAYQRNEIAERAAEKPQTLNVAVDAAGKYAINGVATPFGSTQAFSQAMREAAGRNERASG